ncbi:MAG: autotransporter domain-containing protein [Phascolarctobacterium sp.]|uniref:beta strand repeat-containing protein n=1 Tax=Phascolarctobacterium sp. TaxID=2049039 RepID=UPI0025CB94F0|nr:autotransporter outer membrane beta-barrel domain-containing protein [Phascolarctobacterium sp.]MCC8158467.1 autotransporter domain-containing protein [Phascolarctobacterium sp.]
MMNKKVLTMAVLAAVCGMAAAPVWAANSGGTVNADGKYVGNNGAANNSLLIDTDFSSDIISGLGTGTDAVKNNSIEMSAGDIRGQLIGGMSEGDGDIDSNSITISGGWIGDNVYGGYTEGSGAVINNKVIISGDATEIGRGKVAGGMSMGAGTAAYNNVTVTGGNIDLVVGGGSAHGIAEYNSVTVEGGTIKSKVVGGAAIDNAARHNIVTISGTAEISGDVMGGVIEGTTAGDVTDNSVIISGGKISGDVYGAYTEGDGAVTGNSVIISGAAAEVTRDVFGAVTEGSGAVAYNSVTVTDGLLNHEVYGGGSMGTGIVEYNSVTVSGGTINMSTCGGVSMGNIARYNSVTITGGTVKGSVVGGGSEINAIENKVWISGGSIGGDVYGADNRAGSATGNEVIISGTPTFDSTYGTDIYGGSTYDGDIIGNKVTISGAPVFNISDPDSGVKIYGGYVGNDGSVTGNSVEINGDMNFAAALEIYGGYSNGTGAVTGNSVTISGRPTFTDDTVIYGGYSNSGGEVSGNILNIKNTDITVPNIKNFDVYNFYLPNTVRANDILLTVTGGSGNEQTDLKNSTVNVGIAGSAPALQSGDNVTLLHNANGVLVDGTTVYGKITQGVSLEYEFTTALANGDSLVTTITRTGINDDTKSLVETQAAAVGFINSGADLLAGSGITSMSEVTSAEDSTIFGAMSGGSMRYDTGSHADVKGYNFALGMGKAVVNNAGKLTFGPFVEYGYGDYTSYLDNGVRGDGKTKYYGVGVLARQDNNSGVYYEGSLRYGRMDADYASNDLGTAGVHSSYDSSSAYYGAHLGIGKVTELNDTTKADVYAKLLYTHQNGDSVTLQGEGNGEVYDFDAVDSTRARVGARVSKAYSERGTGYVGLAYEYEFDGEARATVKGFSTPSPSIKGSSGLLELGYILQPKGVNDPTINIGLQGWGGKKQGITGNVNFVWKF